MEKDIYMLIDYKDYFGSKQKSFPYKSGMDKILLTEYFKEYGFRTNYLSFAEVDFSHMDFAGRLVLYTSSEDKGYYYKSYIDDIVFGLSCQGAHLIPDYRFLHANNNKVFMEILRDLVDKGKKTGIKSIYLGTLEDLKKKTDHLNSKLVLKTTRGAMSSGVYLVKNKKDTFRRYKKLGRTRYLYSELWDLKNYLKHKNFKMDSRFRSKFILQNFVEGLKHDWKVLVYGHKYYVLQREVRKKDFRASGSGIFKFTEHLPEGLLDYAYEIFELFNVPNFSMDIGYNGGKFYVFEFQAVYFGTKTIENASFYFLRKNSSWEIRNEKTCLEKVYVESIAQYINKNSIQK